MVGKIPVKVIPVVQLLLNMMIVDMNWSVSLVGDGPVPIRTILVSMQKLVP